LVYLVEISWCSAACWRRRLTCCFRFPRLLSSTSLSRSNQCVNAVFYVFPAILLSLPTTAVDSCRIRLLDAWCVLVSICYLPL